MQCDRLNVEDVGAIVFGVSPCLLGDKGEGIALVHQPKLSIGTVFRARVQVNSTFDEVAMKVSDKAADVSRIQSCAVGVSATSDELLHSRW